MKNLLIIFFFIFSFNSLLAQERPHSGVSHREKWERIDALKLQFVMKKLQLPSSTENKLIPVYNNYQQALRNVYAERRRIREQNKANPGKQVDTDFSFESKILAVKQEYKKKFETILNSEQLNTLYSSEREFREELMQQLKKN
ncbi:hypothetical protein [Pseudopedobacter sp.]|uniref:hypothetical protein n=1 Tax=Pseudopedobacter sp. TaxID=1936787 RepID=UPI00334248FF